MSFVTSRSMPYMTNIAHVVTRMGGGDEVGIYAMPVCVLFVSSRSGIVFNPSADTIIDHSQSAKVRPVL